MSLLVLPVVSMEPAEKEELQEEGEGSQEGESVVLFDTRKRKYGAKSMETFAEVPAHVTVRLTTACQTNDACGDVRMHMRVSRQLSSSIFVFVANAPEINCAVCLFCVLSSSLASRMPRVYIIPYIIRCMRTQEVTQEQAQDKGALLPELVDDARREQQRRTHVRKLEADHRPCAHVYRHRAFKLYINGAQYRP